MNVVTRVRTTAVGDRQELRKEGIRHLAHKNANARVLVLYKPLTGYIAIIDLLFQGGYIGSKIRKAYYVKSFLGMLRKWGNSYRPLTCARRVAD